MVASSGIANISVGGGQRGQLDSKRACDLRLRGTQGQQGAKRPVESAYEDHLWARWAASAAPRSGGRRNARG